MHCPNCHHEMPSRFCAHCGQEHLQKRLSFKYIIQDIFGSFLNLERGLLATYRDLLVKPRIVIDLYIKGFRKIYFNPYRLMFVSLTIYAFVLFFSQSYISSVFEETELNDKIDFNFEYMGTIVQLAYLIQIPLAAFFYYLFFKKFKQNNYAEIVSILVYITAGNILFVQIPYNFLLWCNLDYMIPVAIAFFLNIWYQFYCLKRYFQTSWITTVGRGLLSHFFTILVSVILGIAVGLTISKLI